MFPALTQYSANIPAGEVSAMNWEASVDLPKQHLSESSKHEIRVGCIGRSCIRFSCLSLRRATSNERAFNLPRSQLGLSCFLWMCLSDVAQRCLTIPHQTFSTLSAKIDLRLGLNSVHDDGFCPKYPNSSRLINNLPTCASMLASGRESELFQTCRCRCGCTRARSMRFRVWEVGDRCGS